MQAPFTVFCHCCEDTQVHRLTYSDTHECQGCGNTLTAEQLRAQLDGEAAFAREWRQERATQAGMGFGCDGFNDAMGY
jgi:ribosomal protein L37AE/L43A